jgi:hypothetical protein
MPAFATIRPQLSESSFRNAVRAVGALPGERSRDIDDMTIRLEKPQTPACQGIEWAFGRTVYS